MQQQQQKTNIKYLIYFSSEPKVNDVVQMKLNLNAAKKKVEGKMVICVFVVVYRLLCTIIVRMCSKNLSQAKVN